MTLAYDLLAEELAVLDSDADVDPEPEAEPEAEPEPEPDGFVPSPRDVAYYIKVYDAALLAIDQIDVPDDQPSLAELLATRDRAPTR